MSNFVEAGPFFFLSEFHDEVYQTAVRQHGESRGCGRYVANVVGFESDRLILELDHRLGPCIRLAVRVTRRVVFYMFVVGRLWRPCAAGGCTHDEWTESHRSPRGVLDIFSRPT